MDDAFFFLLALGLGLWLLVGPLVALVTARRALAEARSLRAELAALRPQPAATAETMAAPVAEPAPEVTPAATPEPRPEPEAPPEPSAPEPAPAFRPSLEQRLAQRWLVWLGGIALALGGIFVVKTAIDQGWLGPVVRLLLGGALGVALIGLGERLRRRGVGGYVPAALAAAGVATLFAAVWAAHALYALLPGIPTFALLAATAALAVLLAWSHGPFLAALGLAGAFLVPALVGAEAPAAAPLLGYLLVPTVGGLAILRYRPWPWLAWLVLAGAVPWLWLATLAPWRGPVATVSFILAAAAAFLLAPGQAQSRALRWAVAAAAWLLALSALGLHLTAGPTTTTSLGLLLLAALPIALAWRYAIGAAAPVAAGVAVLLALLTWQLELFEVGRELTGEAEIALPPLRLLPEAATVFVAWAVAFSALFVAAGLALALRGHRPGLWSTLSAGFPVLAFAIAYVRLSDFSPSLSWAGLALALAAAMLGLASLVARRAGPPEALAAYAVGTAAGLALACTMALEQAWLTTALAALLPAIGWVWRRLAVPGLRSAAFVLALVVVARAALAPETLLLAGGGPAPALAWSLYALGLPVLAFLAAAQLFRTGAADRLAALLAAGALVFWLLLAFAFVRWLSATFGDGLMGHGIVERALHGAIWLATAYGLLRRDVIAPSLLIRSAAAILAVVAAIDIVLVQLLELNPLWTGEPVGELPLVNALLLAYALPALLAYLMARELAKEGHRHLAGGTAVLSLVLALAWLGLEVRRAFHGPVLIGPLGEAESWTYSALLILAALALLAAGILRASRAIRLAALAVLMLAVAKVFLMDLADLEGLWRAASFLGLGFSLLAIGLAYQRFVRTGERQPAT